MIASLIEAIRQAAQLNSANQDQKIAVFDADGTLWKIDSGELFLKYLIKNGLIRDIPSHQAWEHYLAKRWGGEADVALDWIVRQAVGLDWTKVRELAEHAFKEIPNFPYFPEIKTLINFLIDHEFQIYVVSASPKWAVEPGARYFGIPRDNVLGLCLKEENGIFKDELLEPRSVGAGKSLALAAATHNMRPWVAVGNTPSDLSLLEIAEFPIAIRSAAASEKIFASEEQLYEVACARNWWRLRL